MRITVLLVGLFFPLLSSAADGDVLLRERTRDLESRVPTVRARAANLLGEMGDRAASPALLRALVDEEKAVRREAARALGNIRDRNAVDALVKALKDRDNNVRLYAVHALGEIRDSKAMPALLAALSDREYGVREEAAWALRELRAPELIPRLVECLGDPKADEEHIIWILRHLGAAGVVKALAPLLDNPEATTRRRAVQVLVALESEAAVPCLIRATRDTDLAVRRAAIGALRETWDERVLEAFEKALSREKDADLRQVLAEAIEWLSRDPHLAAWWSFDDGDARVAKDVTGLGTDGQIIRCRVVKGKVGRGLSFGPGQYVELGKPVALKVSGRPMTVMAWVKPQSERGVLVARGGAACGYSLYILDGVPKFGIHRTEDGPGFLAAAREKVSRDWVHLAGVVEKNRIRLYVNGKLAATTSTTGFLPSECGQGMEIGFDVGNSSAEICESFQGVIDEVKVFNIALPAEEIAREAEAGD